MDLKLANSRAIKPSDQAAVDEMMTRWVAAIADQVGNPLASISAAMEIIAKEINRFNTEGAEFSTSLEPVVGMIRTRLESLNSYLTHLKSFSQEIKLHKRSILVMEIIKVSVTSTSKLSGDQLIVNSRCIPENLTITADPAKLENAISALIVNAIEAVPIERTPELLISAQPCPSAVGEVMITISDNGTGFKGADTEELRRPFQSTKEARDGLGLSTAEKIVKAHNGRIEIMSANGELGGADIQIILPIHIDAHKADPN